jgi:hypothetical protein
MTITPTQAKWTHAVAVALVGVLTDTGAQLAAHGGAADLSRSVVIGLVMGGAARLLGAFIASRVGV